MIPSWSAVVHKKRIGVWLIRMRTEARCGMLSPGEMKQIEDALGVDVLVPIVDFERTLTEVAEHRRLHGKNPKTCADSSDESRLGIWLRERRFGFNEGSLSEAHSDRLDAVLGLEWRPEFKNDAVCPLSSSASDFKFK